MELKIDYICSLVNLYGHVSPEKVCEVYNLLNHADASPFDFEILLTNPEQRVEDRYVYIKDGKFIEESLYLFQEKYEELCAQQADKPHYVPEKEELMEYKDLHYWEKPLEYEELETYISTHFFPNHADTAKNLAEEIFSHIMANHFKGCLQTLVHYEVILDEEKALDPFLNILQRLNNNTRMRAHNAHTPIEISQLTGESVYILPDKVLEDGDDCHCGSKKTYKDCHMKDDDKIRRLNEYRSGLKEV